MGQQVGVRLNDQDLAALDRVRGFRTRSDAIRRLIREAADHAPPESEAMAWLHDQLKARYANARAQAQRDTERQVEEARKLSTGT